MLTVSFPSNTDAWICFCGSVKEVVSRSADHTKSSRGAILSSRVGPVIRDVDMITATDTVLDFNGDNDCEGLDTISRQFARCLVLRGVGKP